MILLVLSVILVLVVAGCASVVWAARGGPPWTRAVAKATMAAGELVRASGRSTGNRNRSNDSSTLGGD
ncbi:hypothetical protein ACWEWD_07755 [Streptomyces tendae]|uniref:hypothetical protein n=1 Tax=Streptomyces tendae TaxID=1932 RepID=UPI00167C2E7E|nr:hypothetical protein [Streptomyces tendae]GHA87971.1 hypothetical protein GCM10010330_47670 [Streptomyces tendae]